jgi:hypothetical protein
MRKGQAALEFLTTYGWAILIILVMIGAIAYFGVLNPSKFLPSKCMVSAEFSCDDYQLKDSQAIFLLKQTQGKTIYWYGTTCTFNDPVAGVQTDEGTATIGASVLGEGSQWSPRDTVRVVCDMPAGTLSLFKGEKSKVYFNMTYRISATGLDRTGEGEIYAQVQ